MIRADAGARALLLALGHRLALLLYVVVALFPLFWLLKIALTPNQLLYSEGVALWPSATTLAKARPASSGSENSLVALGKIGPTPRYPAPARTAASTWARSWVETPMSRCGPATRRASRTDTSSWPRWTPSAPARRAMSGRSLTTNRAFAWDDRDAALRFVDVL